MTKQAGTAPFLSPVPAQPAFPGWETTALSAFRRANETYAEACFGWNRELAAFMQGRLAAGIEAQQELSKCRDWQEIARVQQDWAATAARDCCESAARLMRIASGAPEGAAVPSGEAKPEPGR